MDVSSPDKLLDVLNPLQETLAGALSKGVSLENLRHIRVTMKLTPPDEWTALDLLDGCTVWNAGSHGVPACRWTSVGTQYRGLLQRPSAGSSFTAFARVPDSVSTLRPATSVVHPAVAAYTAGSVDVDANGYLYLSSPSTFPASNFVSLWGVTHASTPTPPLWAPQAEYERVLTGDGGQDYGTPYLVLCLGATRGDRAQCTPDLVPQWEAPQVGRAQQRVLRIRRLGGLEAGVEHTVTLLCLYP